MGPLPNGLLLAYKWGGDPNQLLPGMILQVSYEKQNTFKQKVLAGTSVQTSSFSFARIT